MCWYFSSSFAVRAVIFHKEKKENAPHVSGNSIQIVICGFSRRVCRIALAP